ncbi:hypothetical protein [Streptomyces anulatus]|uniref:hypothetical protein n=1 Tax=Streptomyces anulatus TaxID=1892 RepID=UPI0019407CD7|nr:hypothetical protein [Streptomyces anulatus]
MAAAGANLRAAAAVDRFVDRALDEDRPPAPHDGPLRNLQRASHRLHNLLKQSATTAAADVEVFEAIDIIVPDGLLIPDLVLVDAAAAEQATANT